MTNNAIDTFFLPKIARSGCKALSINKWVLFGNHLVVLDVYDTYKHLVEMFTSYIYNDNICTCCSTKLDKNKHKTTEIGKKLQICINFAYKTKTKNKHVARKRGFIAAQDVSGKVKIMFGITLTKSCSWANTLGS